MMAVIKFLEIPVRGIDVSEFNGMINWDKPAQMGADFTSIRVGFGRVLDARFTVNWKATKGKIKRFPYWYMDYYSNHNPASSANGISDKDWGILQAETCWNAIRSDPEGTVFLDIENANPKTAPAITTLSKRAQTIAQAFLTRMDQLNGKKNGIYCSLGLLTWFTTWFKDRPLWVAWYNENQTPATVIKAVKAAGWLGRCVIWQCSSHGNLNGEGTGAGDGILFGMQYKFLDFNWFIGSDVDYADLFGQPVIVVPGTPDDETVVIPPAAPNTRTIEVLTTTRPVTLRTAPRVSILTFIRIIPEGKPIDCLERVTDTSGNTWIRCGIEKQFVAEKYAGIIYLK